MKNHFAKKTAVMKQEHLGYLLTRASKTIKKKLLEIVSDYDLTQPQYGILRQLYNQDGMAARDIVNELYMDSSTIMSIIDRLEKKKLIKRISHKQDRRLKLLVLTESAKGFLPELLAKTNALDTSMNDIFTAEENKTLRRCLTKLYQFGADIERLSI